MLLYTYWVVCLKKIQNPLFLLSGVFPRVFFRWMLKPFLGNFLTFQFVQ